MRIPQCGRIPTNPAICLGDVFEPVADDVQNSDFAVCSLERSFCRMGLVIAATALLQDPIRKALPGQPAYWLLLFLIPAVGGLIGVSGTLTSNL